VTRYLFAFMLVSSTAYGSAILATDSAAFNKSDTVLWSQFAGTVSQTFFPVSQSYNYLTGRFDNGVGTVLTAGPDLAASGGIMAGDELLATASGSGPVTFYTGRAVYGAGAFIDSLGSGAFTARIQAFSGVMSILDTTVKSDAAGDALFIGFSDASAEVTKIVFSLTSGLATDFALDTLHLQTTPFAALPPAIVLAPTASNPEPEMAPVMALALAGLAFVYRKRKLRV